MLACPSPRTRDALGRLAGPLAAGALLTIALGERAPELLPGLWQVCFALALFAVRPLLPREITLVAAFYLVSGVLVLGSTSPAAMGVPFAVGQTAAAVVLRFRHA
jgi:hypothetical protein